MINNIYAYNNISTASTTQIFSGGGTLGMIVVNNSAAGAITVYDGTTNANPIATLKASVAEGTYTYNVNCGIGLRVVTAAGSDITVCYKVH